MILPIKKFSKMNGNKWSTVKREKMLFKIHFDQIFVITDDTVLEYYKIKQFLRGAIKCDVLILLYQQEDKIQKVKFSFSCDKKEIDEMIKILEINIIITKSEEKHDSPEKNNVSFDHLLAVEMTRQRSTANLGTLFPKDFPIDQFIKTCLLDPEFPNFVDRVESIVNGQK